MEKKSYEELVAAVADGLTAIADLKVKQEAWELSLKSHNPGFHDHYQNQIGLLKSGKAFEGNLAAIARLKERQGNPGNMRVRDVESYICQKKADMGTKPRREIPGISSWELVIRNRC